MKIRSVGAVLLHADGRAGGRKDKRTHIVKLIVAFRNFANAPQHDYGWEAHKDLKVTDRLLSQRSSGGTKAKHESPNQHSHKHSCESKPILREASLPLRNRYALTMAITKRQVRKEIVSYVFLN